MNLIQNYIGVDDVDKFMESSDNLKSLLDSSNAKPGRLSDAIYLMGKYNDNISDSVEKAIETFTSKGKEIPNHFLRSRIFCNTAKCSLWVAGNGLNVLKALLKLWQLLNLDAYLSKIENKALNHYMASFTEKMNDANPWEFASVEEYQNRADTMDDNKNINQVVLEEGHIKSISDILAAKENKKPMANRISSGSRGRVCARHEH